MSVIQNPKVFALLAWIAIVTVTVDLGKFQLPMQLYHNNVLELELTGIVVLAKGKTERITVEYRLQNYSTVIEDDFHRKALNSTN